ncbi:MAG: F-box protein [Candidatus Thiodiazotropha sp.]
MDSTSRRLIRKRKLSPSGSKARIVESSDGSVYAEISDSTQKCTRISFGAMTLLHGLLMAALSGKEPAKPSRPPVRRKIDFDNIFHIETEEEDDYISCGQTTPLPSLEVALTPGYLHDGWMTSRTDDIKWLSEVYKTIRPAKRFESDFLGVRVNIGSAASSQCDISPRTYDSIRTPSSELFSVLPEEIVYKIMDYLHIRDVLNMSQTCKRFNALTNNPHFWRHRLMRDFHCYSIGICGDESKLPVIREAYKLTYSVDENDDLYEEMV